jgi:hypothetical protein
VASVVRARAGRRAVEAWEQNLRRYDGDERDDGVEREDKTIHAFGDDDDVLIIHRNAQSAGTRAAGAFV